MCLIDSIEQIHEATGALKSAKEELAQFERMTSNALDGGSAFDTSELNLTESETRLILEQRVKKAAEMLNSLVYVKAAPADPADSQRVINQR